MNEMNQKGTFMTGCGVYDENQIVAVVEKHIEAAADQEETDE